MANDIIDIIVTDNSDNVQLNVTPNLVSINVSQTSGNIIGSNYFLASTFGALPITGDTTTLYVINDTSLMYRWSGSAYTQINSSAVVAWGQITGALSGQTDLQNALNAKAPLASPTFTGTVSGITKSMVGLSNVDNTSDVDKPVSTATQTALDLKANSTDVTSSLALKANINNPTFTGTVSGITKSMVGLGNVDNTTDLLKPISTATQSALNLKYDASNPSGYTTNVGTVTSVGGTGTVSGLSLSGSVTTSGNLTLGGTLSLTSGNVTTALGYTPYNATNPSGYISGITSGQVTTALGYTPENSANKGIANGYASLDGGGLVPSNQLPSYVDDVLEYADLAAFPASGTTGKIYVALDTNKIYRWSGATYIEVSPTVGTIWGGITGTLSNQTDLQNALNAKQDDITLTTTGTSGAATFISNTLNIPNYAPDLSGYVPYTGASTNVNLGTHSLTAADLVINHVSGSGVAASITKGGSGEALTVVKTSGSGNAASITGGVTLLDELHLNTDLADAYIASATNWNTAYTNRITSLTTTGSSGSATLVSNVLNIPTYTLSGLGGITASFLSGTSGISYNSTTGVISTSLTQYTDALARASVSLTTTGTSGASTYNSTTGVLNIPQYQAVLTNPVTGTGTTNYVAKFTSSTTIGNSIIYDDGTNVGIGTITPESFTSYRTLEISNTAGGVIFAKSTTGVITTQLLADNASSVGIIGTRTNHSLNITTNNTTRLAIATTGAATFSSSVTAGANITASGTGNITIQAISSNNFPVFQLVDNRVGGSIWNFEGGRTLGNLALRDSNAGIERMTWTNTGNVGIGTSSPSQKLHISDSSAVYCRIVNTAGADVYLGSESTQGVLSVSNNLPLDIRTNNTTRLYVTSGGALLIGVTTEDALGGITIRPTGTTMVFNNLNTAPTVMSFQYNSSAVGSITRTTTTTSYNITSDYRLKEDLKPINGLEKVSGLNVYDFKWKSSDDRMDGFLAHELQEVLPYAVSGIKDGEDMQQVDYSKIVPVLVKAIQELSAKVTLLENK
jgi:hypothetical protein